MNNLKACIVILIAVLLHSENIFSQQKSYKLGAGYFGETVTHPGIVFEGERENRFASQMGITTRLDLGFYTHPRSHNALFIDINQGFRRYFDNGLFLEQSLGIGTMVDFYNEDVWHIESNGDAVRVSRWGNYNLMPSVSTGLGYLADKNTSYPKLFWIRPELFWQLPFNNLALPHFAVQVGVTITLKRDDKVK